MTAQAYGNRLGGLQSLRGIAALAVLFQHVTFYSCVAKGVDYMTYLKIDFGRFGVWLFFLISGFVMAGCRRQGSSFLMNRVIRIYPGYWLAIFFSFIILWRTDVNWVWTWESFFLIPAPLNQSYRIPYWTLIYEMGFYVLVYGLIQARIDERGLNKFSIGWLFAILIASFYVAIPFSQPGAWLWLGYNNVFFVFGFLLGLNYQKLSNIPSLPLALVAMTCYLVGGRVETVDMVAASFVLAIAFAALVLLGIRHLRSRILERLGDASYGIYLLHVPVVTLAIHFATRTYPAIGLYELWLVAMIAALTGSVLFGLLEHRVHAKMKMWARGPRT